MEFIKLPTCLASSSTHTYVEKIYLALRHTFPDRKLAVTEIAELLGVGERSLYRAKRAAWTGELLPFYKLPTWVCQLKELTPMQKVLYAVIADASRGGRPLSVRRMVSLIGESSFDKTRLAVKQLIKAGLIEVRKYVQDGTFFRAATAKKGSPPAKKGSPPAKKGSPTLPKGVQLQNKEQTKYRPIPELFPLHPSIHSASPSVSQAERDPSKPIQPSGPARPYDNQHLSRHFSGTAKKGTPYEEKPMDEATLRTLAGSKQMEPKERKERRIKLKKLHIEKFGKPPLLPYKNQFKAFLSTMKERGHNEEACWDFLEWAAKNWASFRNLSDLEGIKAFKNEEPSYSFVISSFGLERLVPLWEKGNGTQAADVDSKEYARKLLEMSRGAGYYELSRRH